MAFCEASYLLFKLGEYLSVITAHNRTVDEAVIDSRKQVRFALAHPAYLDGWLFSGEDDTALGEAVMRLRHLEGQTYAD